MLSLALCAARIEEAAPALLRVLERAARGEALSENDACLLFRGLHILGGARRAEAFAPPMQLLRRPFDDVDFLLGDAATLFAAIEDAGIDEFIH